MIQCGISKCGGSFNAVFRETVIIGNEDEKRKRYTHGVGIGDN